MDPQHALIALNFGRVDGESDHRFNTCFIGTEMLRNVLLPQHTLLVGNKGSGKSTICRLLIDDQERVRPLLPKGFKKIYCIPSFGLRSEEEVPDVSLKELDPNDVDDFRDFWLLYLGIKSSRALVQDEKLAAEVELSTDAKVKESFAILKRVLESLGLGEKKQQDSSLGSRLSGLFSQKDRMPNLSDLSTSVRFKDVTGVSVIAVLDHVDIVLKGTHRLAWMMLDKLDLLYVDDYAKLKASITGLVQLLVQYGNHFRHIHLKIFLRNDIFRQLHIVNKSHLITYTTEMRWRDALLLKLLVARAIDDPVVRAYCQQVTGQEIDVTRVILGEDEFVEKIFYAIFEDSMGTRKSDTGKTGQGTHLWILKRLVDGTGSSYPRELIHLGNRAVERQREMNRVANKHLAERLISADALRDAFDAMSAYRCDTYLYSEFPHLKHHFDVFRGSDSATFSRQELYMLFEPLSPKGDEAIRAVYDTGLIIPLDSNVDSSRKFRVPLLYKAGMGIKERRARLAKKVSGGSETQREEVPVVRPRTDEPRY